MSSEKKVTIFPIPGPGTAMALAAGATGFAMGAQQNQGIALMMLILGLFMVFATLYIERKHKK